MSGWLLDTNVLSELRKPRCSPAVRRWVRSRPPKSLYVSRITFAEIRFGISRLSDPNRRHELNRWLDEELRPWFEGRILEVNEDVVLRWREMVEAGRQSGRTYSQPDLFLAATADLQGLCLATRNQSDFEGTDVAIVNPWEE